LRENIALEAPQSDAPPLERARVQLGTLLADPERTVCLGLVTLAVLFNLVFLLPELTSRPPDLNDNVFHWLNLQRANEALTNLHDPTDPWLNQIALGYPVFHYYQHLPYLVPAFLHVVTFLPLEGLFHALNYLLLCSFPVSIYWSMRRFEFDRVESALAAVVSSVISTDGLFGFDFNSYVWAGYGLYTQLWGMLLLPPALALSYRVVRGGGSYLWAVILLSLTVLSHLAFGYVAFASLVVFAALSPSWRELRARGQRVLALAALTVGVTSYFLVPLALGSEYLNHSVWDPTFKYDSFGAEQILKWLLQGELFDHNRLPVLTLLLALGLVVCIVSWRREERYRAAAALFVVWLVLYFGPKTWGGLLDATPLGSDFYFHRLIAGVHLAGIFLAGIGLAAPWRWVQRRGDRRYMAGLAALAVIACAPVYLERADYLHDNRTFMQQTSAAFDSEQQDLDALIAVLKSAPPGRVYAGLAAQWGGQYRVGAVPMHAILTAHGIDNVGFLWHPWSLNGDIQVLFDERRPEQYDLFNVRYVVAPEGRTFPDFVHLMGSFGRHRLYRVDTTGYFDVVSSDRAFYADKTTFYYAASNWFASAAGSLRLHPTLVFPRQPVPDGMAETAPLTAAQYPSRQQGTSRPIFGTIEAETVEDGRYAAVVDAPNGGIVMLKATYHPGWRAYVDGAPVATRMVMPSYVGIEVAPGRHGVVVEYGPTTQRHLLQFAGILVLAGFAVRRPAWRHLREVMVRLLQRARL